MSSLRISRAAFIAVIVLSSSSADAFQAVSPRQSRSQSTKITTHNALVAPEVSATSITLSRSVAADYFRPATTKIVPNPASSIFQNRIEDEGFVAVARQDPFTPWRQPGVRSRYSVTSSTPSFPKSSLELSSVASATSVLDRGIVDTFVLRNTVARPAGEPLVIMPPVSSAVAAAQPTPLKDLKTSLVSLYNSYEKSLAERPVLTKGISAGIVAGAGDVLSQILVEGRTLQTVNMMRMLNFALSGLLYVGPYLHYFYKMVGRAGQWLENKFNIPPSMRIGAQVFMDQTVGVMIFYPLYFFVHELIEAPMTLRAPLLSVAASKLLKDGPSVIAMQYRIWPVASLLNFSFIPPNFRVLWTKFVSIFWNAYFCAKMATH